MKTTVNFCNFCDAFLNMNRDTQFTYDGKRVLFDWLEEYEASTGEELELDVIALCCEYSEECADDIIANYCLEDDVEGMDDDGKEEYVQEYLQNNTLVCGQTAAGDFVYLQF